MCVTCGCSETEKIPVTDKTTGEIIMMSHEEAHAHGHHHNHHDHYGHHHDYSHPHPEHHSHDHSHATATVTAKVHVDTIALEKEILGKNQLIAERNRGWLAGRNILALNLVSSPGSGKTTLLERTINDLKNEFEIGVIEGDQETVNDAERIRSTGCQAVQINTGTGCHLEAEMLARGLESLNPSPNSLLFIENVGNLVCPAMFDLGEKAKVAILSVTEGEDKPLKYPHIFKASDLMLLNKIDLLPYLKFDVEKCVAYAHEVNPNIEVLQVSATTGEGVSDWYKWLKGKHI